MGHSKLSKSSISEARLGKYLWDEACLPARPITVNVTQIQAMLDEARRKSRPLFDVLNKLVEEILSAENNSLLDIPDWKRLVSI